MKLEPKLDMRHGDGWYEYLEGRINGGEREGRVGGGRFIFIWLTRWMHVVGYLLR